MSAQTLTYRCPHCGTPAEVDLHSADEMLTCPNGACRKPFRAEAPVAEPVPELVIPPGMKTAPPPTAPAVPAADAESDLQTIRLLMFRRYPVRCLVYGLLLAVGLAGLIGGVFAGSPLLALAGLALAGFIAGRVLLWWLRTKNTTLKITTQRCILENGLFTKESVEVARQDVVDLSVNQSVLGRMLNVGDVLISANGGKNKRIIQVMAVPNPEAVARRIRDR